MTHLTNEQLTELTRRINERLGEFGKLANNMPTMTPGIVRLVYGVIEQWHEESTPLVPQKGDTEDGELLTIAYGVGFERGKALAKSADTERLVTMTESPVTVTQAPATNGNGHRLSEQATATLGPEHTVVTPIKPDKVVAPKEEMAHELENLRMSADPKAALLRETIHELQVMSVDGAMPTMVEWDEKRPEGMVTAQGIIKRHDLTWGDLARYAKLELKRGKTGK